MRHQFATLALALFASGSALNAAEAIELKAQWPVGQRFVTQLTMNQNQKIVGAPTGPMNQTVTQVQEIAVDVARRLSGGGRDLELSWLSMKMDMKMGSVTMMSYDSKNKNASGANNPLAGVMDNIVGNRLYMELNADGDVVSVEGLDDLLEGVGGGGGVVGSMMKGMFTEDSVKQLGVLPQGLPKEPVKVGDEWPYELEFPMGPAGVLKVDMDYTFSGLEDRDGRKCAVLEYTGTMQSKAGGGGDSAVDINIKEGTIKGKTWFDYQAGVTVENKGDVQMQMAVGAMGQNMTIEVDQDVHNKLVRVQRIPR